MKSFYSGIYVSKELLAQNRRDNPIRLEYYRIKNEKTNEKESYGIEVVKTEYIDGKPNVETETIENITDNERTVNQFLDCLKHGYVTPISAKEIVDDYFGKI